MHRRLLVALVTPLLVVAAACGSDDSSSESTAAESDTSVGTDTSTSGTSAGGAGDNEAFCAAGAELRTNIESLADASVITSGLSGLEDTLSEIVGNVEDMRAAGGDIATAEIEELQSSLDALQQAVADLGGNLSVTAAGDIANAIGDVGTAGSAVLGAYTAACE
jgi:hypothetical protein